MEKSSTSSCSTKHGNKGDSFILEKALLIVFLYLKTSISFQKLILHLLLLVLLVKKFWISISILARSINISLTFNIVKLLFDL